MIEILNQAKLGKKSNKLMMKSLIKFKADWQLLTLNCKVLSKMDLMKISRFKIKRPANRL